MVYLPIKYQINIQNIKIHKATCLKPRFHYRTCHRTIYYFDIHFCMHWTSGLLIMEKIIFIPPLKILFANFGDSRPLQNCACIPAYNTLLMETRCFIDIFFYIFCLIWFGFFVHFHWFFKRRNYYNNKYYQIQPLYLRKHGI